MATRVRKRSGTDENEAKLFKIITRDAPPEIKGSHEEIGQFTKPLTRELRIITELPGKVTTPLTRKRRDVKVVKLTCTQLLEAIEPLAELLHLAIAMPVVPEMVYAPDDLDLDPHLRVLRWFLEDGEQLHGIVFPHEANANNFPGKLSAAVLGKLLDAAWDALKPGKMQVLIPKATSSTFVVVTNHRIITVNPRKLLHYGEPGVVYLPGDVEDMRPRTDNTDHVCPVIGVTTKRSDVRWVLPARAGQMSVDDLATTIGDLVAAATESASGHAEMRTAIASSATETAFS